MKKFLAVILMVMLGACGGKRITDYSNKTDEEIYQSALKNIKREYWPYAVDDLAQIEYNHPYSPLVDESWILMGYSYYKDEKYPEAIETFEKLVRYQPNNEQVPYAMYMIGVSYYDQMSPINRDQRMAEMALGNMEKLVARFPTSKYAEDVKPKILIARNALAAKEMDIARELIRKKNIIGALNRYQTVVAKYQTSLFVPEALFRTVEIYLILDELEDAENMARLLDINYPENEWNAKAKGLIADFKENGEKPRVDITLA